MDITTYDAWSLLQSTSIPVLDKGSVTIIDFSPRICPVGWTPEFRIVQAARVSFGKGLTTPEADAKLCRYLLTNKHTSPIEMVNVTLCLYVPIAINVQFLRHRTGKFNQFSQRYSEVTKDEYYNPLQYQAGIRLSSNTNKQSSVSTDDNHKIIAIKKLMTEANELLDRQHYLYHEMIKLDLAKEIARFWLPISEYTTTYMQFDLNNLIKLLTLRADAEHAQREIVEYANAIITLVTPLFPTCFRVFQEQRAGMYLTQAEITALKESTELDTTSVSEKRDFVKKKERLGIL